MALVVYTDGYAQNGVIDIPNKKSKVTLQGSWTGLYSEPLADFGGAAFDWGVSVITENSGPITPQGGLGYCVDTNNGGFEYAPGVVTQGFLTQTYMTSDEDYSFRARILVYGNGCWGGFEFNRNGSPISFRAYALDSTSSTPVAVAGGNPQTDINVTANFFPNTLRSTVTATVQYRVNGSGAAWTNVTTTGYATSGYAETTASASITGLACGTTYEIRLHLTRTTQNSTTHDSASTTLATGSCAPAITTNAASNISDTTATLNLTVDPNNIQTRVLWGWGTSDGGATLGSWANQTATQTAEGDGNQAFSQGLSGLAPSTLYFFRAFVQYPSPGFGTTLAASSSLSFTTLSAPGTPTAQENQMLFQYDAVYGVSKKFAFQAAATGADTMYNGASLWVNTECIINTYVRSTDTWALSTIVNPDGRATNGVTRVGTSAHFYITLTAAELSFDEIIVWISNAGVSARDVCLRIRTRKYLGQETIDASQIGSNVDAVAYTPHGTGRGLRASQDIVLDTGLLAASGATSATLASSAVATAQYYKDCTLVITAGPGAGQARIIQAYSAGRVCTVTAWLGTTPNTSSTYMVLAYAVGVWDQLEGPEPTTVLEQAGDGSTFRKIIQWLKRRRFNKNTQTATTQIVYRDDGVFGGGGTVLGTRSVSDNGTTQEQGEFS